MAQNFWTVSSAKTIVSLLLFLRFGCCNLPFLLLLCLQRSMLLLLLFFYTPYCLSLLGCTESSVMITFVYIFFPSAFSLPPLSFLFYASIIILQTCHQFVAIHFISGSILVVFLLSGGAPSPSPSPSTSVFFLFLFLFSFPPKILSFWRNRDLGGLLYLHFFPCSMFLLFLYAYICYKPISISSQKCSAGFPMVFMKSMKREVAIIITMEDQKFQKVACKKAPEGLTLERRRNLNMGLLFPIYICMHAPPLRMCLRKYVFTVLP